MTTTELYRIAERDGVTVERFLLEKNKSVSLLLGKRLYVGLDGKIAGADEKVCLAHELGHCETMSFYNMYSPLDVRGKHERRADIWAIKKLIPRTRYFWALRHGYDNVYLLAEYFGVTPEFALKTAEYYSRQTA
ncbi:MAG: ImmA/IrrE family metallo-endopeptidase [Clostridia bacterium]|nr:ImmA/IrrE family metallo-endopeptidase [Clostridia bacterium]